MTQAPPNAAAPSLCRTCLRRAPAGADRCPACGAPRLIAHPELFDLAIAHVDCDAFYAAVEKRDDPSLADQPVIVGGGRRGVVSAACYIARSYGVRSAMPMFKALKACPDAVVVRPNMEKYVEVSRQIRALMSDLTPLVQPISIDEAFLDLTGTERLHKTSPAESLAGLALSIEKEVGVTASVGLSHNKFLAKVASDLDKPRGFSVIGRAETLEFLRDKPVSLIWGVGAKFQARLEAQGIRTIGTLQEMDPAELARRYGEMGLRLARLSRGEDARSVHAPPKAKSVSAERTFESDISDPQALADRLWPLCEKVAARTKAKGWVGRVVTLKLRRSDFQIITRRRTLAAPTALAGRIFATANELLTAEATQPYRLIGVGLSGLIPEAEAESDLFADEDQRLADMERALDRVRDKFGAGAIGSGRALRRQKVPTDGKKRP